jgi:hypothetical protein
VGQRAEAVPVGFGDAEQLADDGHREAEREELHEIDAGRLGFCFGHRVEECHGDALDRRLQSVRASRAEGGRHQGPDAAVVRRVRLQDGLPEGVQRALRTLRVPRQPRRLVDLAEPGAAQYLVGLGVAGDQHDPGPGRCHRSQLARRFV